MISTSGILWQREGCTLSDRQIDKLHAIASRDDRNATTVQYAGLPTAMFTRVGEVALDADRKTYFAVTVLNCGHSVEYRTNYDGMFRRLNNDPTFVLPCPVCEKAS